MLLSPSPGPSTAGPGSRPRSGRPGLAAIEFAIVAPLLVLLILGMIEFGRMIMVQQILTNGAREGARKAVLPGVTDTMVQKTIDDYLKNADIKGFSRSVSPSTDSAAGGTSITVTVSVPYKDVTWLPVGQFLTDKTLSASVVMRKE
jgi:Flp pilus assembly protein TadG